MILIRVAYQLFCFPLQQIQGVRRRKTGNTEKRANYSKSDNEIENMRLKLNFTIGGLFYLLLSCRKIRTIPRFLQRCLKSPPQKCWRRTLESAPNAYGFFNRDDLAAPIFSVLQGL
jgi:hypothetical protein